MLVRGRIYDDTKPKTFNMPWSEGEKVKYFMNLFIFHSNEIKTNSKNFRRNWKNFLILFLTKKFKQEDLQKFQLH